MHWIFSICSSRSIFLCSVFRLLITMKSMRASSEEHESQLSGIWLGEASVSGRKSETLREKLESYSPHSLPAKLQVGRDCSSTEASTPVLGMSCSERSEGVPVSAVVPLLLQAQGG